MDVYSLIYYSVDSSLFFLDFSRWARLDAFVAPDHGVVREVSEVPLVIVEARCLVVVAVCERVCGARLDASVAVLAVVAFSDGG
ncbi:MAG: hypothetical protein R6U96_16150 [Promethearchaeia archaeon]